MIEHSSEQPVAEESKAHTDPMHSVEETVIREVDARLRRIYGISRLDNKEDPLDELIFIILSGKTREPIYRATFDALTRRFPTWDDAAKVGRAELEKTIHFGGLAEKKAASIERLLMAIVSEIGRADLSFLYGQDDASAETFLRRLPGVGPKTARCVLAYSLGRSAFAVDSNVARLMRRLQWSEHEVVTARVQDRLQALVPSEIRYSLHVNFVVHGRSICTALHPACGDCVLFDLCPSGMLLSRGIGIS